MFFLTMEKTRAGGRVHYWSTATGRRPPKTTKIVLCWYTATGRRLSGRGQWPTATLAVMGPSPKKNKNVYTSPSYMEPHTQTHTQILARHERSDFCIFDHLRKPVKITEFVSFSVIR